MLAWDNCKSVSRMPGCSLNGIWIGPAMARPTAPAPVTSTRKPRYNLASCNPRDCRAVYGSNHARSMPRSRALHKTERARSWSVARKLYLWWASRDRIISGVCVEVGASARASSGTFFTMVLPRPYRLNSALSHTSSCRTGFCAVFRNWLMLPRTKALFED